MFNNYVFDLDNTLADFNGAGGIARMNEKGFFRNLQPYEGAIETVKAFSRMGNVFILSACINEECKQEKRDWIAEHLPFIPAEMILLINTGESKAKAFADFWFTDSLYRVDILFDDYKENLLAWKQAGGIAIKCGKQYKQERPYHQLIKFDLTQKLINLLSPVREDSYYNEFNY